ncbi:hypothetical protein B296_00033747 [Ensete ventricosum]|uniref:Uncharacterized protein n=1 Tax=Ensete ventricosum TaxID=4639 RepID=A0A426XZX0_ENSVE|nr:hypothetical protein B296_00033747 [Ensete ventricosum]
MINSRRSARPLWFKNTRPANAADRGQPAKPSTRVAGHSHTPCRGGRPPTVRLVAGATARGGVALGSGASRRGGRPLVGRLLAGKGSRLLRRGDNCDDIVRMRRCTHRSYYE